MNEDLYKSVYSELNKIYNKLKIKSNDKENSSEFKTSQSTTNIMTLINYIKNMIDSAILCIAEKKANDYIADIKKKNTQQEYETLLIKYEAQIREHIKMEQELKLIAETFQEQNDELESSNYKLKNEIQENLHPNINKENKIEIANLKKAVKQYKDQITFLTQSEKKLKNQLSMKEKEFVVTETKYKDEIKALKNKILFLEKQHNAAVTSASSTSSKPDIHKKLTDIQTINVYSNYSNNSNRSHLRKNPPSLKNITTNNVTEKIVTKKLNTTMMKPYKNTRSVSANKNYTTNSSKPNTHSKKVIRASSSSLNSSNISTNMIGNIAGNKNSLNPLNIARKSHNSNNNYHKKIYPNRLILKGKETTENSNFNIFLKDFYNEMEEKKRKKKILHQRNKSTDDAIKNKGAKVSKNSSKITTISNEKDVLNNRIYNYNERKYATIAIEKESRHNRSAMDISDTDNYSNTIKAERRPISQNSRLRFERNSSKRCKNLGKNKILNKSCQNIGEDSLLKSSHSRIDSLKK